MMSFSYRLRQSHLFMMEYIMILPDHLLCI